MREILFRGKCKDTKKWVFGDYLADIESAPPGISWILPIGEYEETRVDTETVGQFTGMCDKNGQKVFEGDILEIARVFDSLGTHYSPPIKYPAKAVVKWDLCSWMWEIYGQEKYYLSFPDAWCQYECGVIGNIYDNPELLAE